MAIPKEVVDRVRQLADITQVVAQVVTLKQTGNHFTGLCPFHKEKTPSFKVFPETQNFHCFGCGEGGSVFDFLMRVEGLSFVEAVTQIAGQVGVEIPREGRRRESAGAEDEVYETLELAARFYLAELGAPKGEGARRYLASRHLTDDTIKTYRLGYAPEGWDGLLRALGKFRKPDALFRAGLVVRAKQGNRYYDRFRNRIVFPIMDPRGRVVAFGGRAMGEETPKYLNSSETAVYRKGRTLYGLHEARTRIRQDKRAVVVEGYMDVLALHQAGVQTAVGACGTALTPDHARLLARYAPEIICVFDGDDAGTRAALRAFETLLPTGLLVRAVMLSGGKDPDDVVREGGAEAFEKGIEERQDVVSFFYRQTKGEPRPVAIQRLARLLALVPDDLSRRELVGRASDWFKFDEATFAGSVQRAAARSTSRAPVRAPSGSERTVEMPRGLEADLLRVSLLDPAFVPVIEELATRPEIGRLVEQRLRPAAWALVRAIGKGGTTPATLAERADDPGLAAFALRLQVEDRPDPADLDRLEQDLARRLPLMALEAERDRLRRELSDSSRRGDQVAEAKLLARLRDVNQQLNALAQGDQPSSVG